MTANTQANNAPIHGRVMLVELSISQWSARKIDRKAADQVAQSNNVESRSGTYYKSLIEGGPLEAIKKLATKARQAHWHRTLPWSDAGPRVLSNLAYMEYMQEMATFGAEFDKLVAEFVSEYPLMRQEASRLLGNLFNDADYPDLQRVADKFSFRTNVMPLPIGDDFRCDIGTEEVDRIRAEITATTEASMQVAVRDAYDRVTKVVESYVDRLAGPETVFRDSLVENARQLADILPALNVTNDPRLAAIAAQLKDKLCAHEPEALRHNKTTRRETFEAAMDIQKDLMNFFGGAQ
uniref:DUF3150 domain-containing protein n=1 Tax=viral metagenome TaxID=1070528 RepID=A0A6M3M9J8_9ZZZZ